MASADDELFIRLIRFRTPQNNNKNNLNNNKNISSRTGFLHPCDCIKSGLYRNVLFTFQSVVLLLNPYSVLLC